MRLDRWLRRQCPGLTQGQVQKWLRTGQVRVDGRRAKAGDRLTAGQSVRVPPWAEAEAPERTAPPPDPRDIDLLKAAILYRDDDVIALNKPPGLAVQGGSGTRRHLDGMLDGLRFGADERPRLVHRLDRDTSGVLLLARTVAAAQWLAKAFRARDTRKAYWALVAGVPSPQSGLIRAPLTKRPGPKGERVVADSDGRMAITAYWTVESAGRRLAWLALEPRTGRTHQVRVHCAAVLETPILGDRKYGGEEALSPLAGSNGTRGLHLHARAIRVPRPGGKVLEVLAPPPDHMRHTMAFLGMAPDSGGEPFPDFPPLV